MGEDLLNLGAWWTIQRLAVLGLARALVRVDTPEVSHRGTVQGSATDGWMVLEGNWRYGLTGRFIFR